MAPRTDPDKLRTDPGAFASSFLAEFRDLTAVLGKCPYAMVSESSSACATAATNSSSGGSHGFAWAWDESCDLYAGARSGQEW
jgi:hypothetical protein